jgi:hypothetical protein
MATSRFHVCTSCSARTWASGLFDALLDCVKLATTACSQCGGKTYLELDFPLSLGAEHYPSKVLDAFLPSSAITWPEGDGSSVQFFPFLVIVQPLKYEDQFVWSPYWHLITNADGRVTKKYGQWAPFVDLGAYSSTVAQARAKGYEI